MTLTKIWSKIEREEPLTTRENKAFTDGIIRAIDALANAQGK